MSTIRLTVAQALVRFLAQQYSERDGVRERLIPGCFGIFGHGNVAGVGQALLEEQRRGHAGALGGRTTCLLSGAQRAGYGARGGRLRADAQPAPGAGVHRLDRARLHQHAYRGGPGHDQPDAGAAAAERRLRHPGGQPGAAGTGGPPFVRRVGQRRVPAAVTVLRPHLAARAASAGAAGRDARADRPGRDGGGHARAAAGRADAGLRLAGEAVAHPGMAPGQARPGTGSGFPRPRRHPRRPAATDHRRRRGAVLGGPGRAPAAGRTDRHPGRGHPGRQGRAAVGPPAGRRRNRLRPGPRRPTPWPPRPTSSSGIGTRYSDFTTASRTAFATRRCAS